MANDKITIDLDIDDGKATATIERFEKDAKKSAEKAGNSFAQGFAKSLKYGMLAAAGVIAFGIKKAVDAAIEQENAINRMNQALISSGRFSKEASQQMQDFATSLQKTTTTGDETTLELLALASTMARSNEEAQKMVKASLDLAAGTGMSAEAAVKNLGKSLAGLTGELGESVTAVRTLTVEQLKAGGAIDLIGEKFAGFAASQRNTFSGAVSGLGNAWGDFLEKVGDVIVKSPVVVGLINKLSVSIGEMTESFSSFMKDKNLVRDMLHALIEFGKGVGLFVITPIETLVNLSRTAFHGIKSAIFGVLTALSEPAAQLVGLFAPDSALAQSLQSFSETTSIAMNDSAAATKAAFGDLFGFETTNSMLTFFDSLSTSVDEFVGKADLMVSKTKEVKETAKQSFQEIGAIIKNSATQLISQGIQSIVTSLIQGGNAFGNFAKTALNILGDFAIQMGTFIISSSQAIVALKASILSFAGGFGIAAGIALIAVGAALKSFAGGPSATNAANAGPSINQPTPVSPVDSSPANEQVVSPGRSGPAITLNIQGNVFDRRETGLEIAEVLKETFQTNDVRFA